MRTADSGVTLIEVLIVLTLIGVSAGIVSYALPSDAPERSLEQEAALLAARINLAAERSLTGGHPLSLDWQTDGYSFREWRAGVWDAAQNAPLDLKHTLASGAILTDADGMSAGAVQITPDLLPSSAGIILLSLEAQGLRRTVAFDGAAARISQ